jgi:putative aldouronate transport system substrate-binding protein
MKKRWITKTLAYLLVLVMVFAVAACSGGDKSSDSGDATAKPTQKPSSSGDITPAETGDELDFVTLDWYIGLDEMPDHQMVNDAVNEYLKEKVNANVNLYYWPAADWETKMTTMLSAGQDVGIVGFGSQSKLDYVVQSNRGSFYPLDDLLNEYAADTLALFPQEIWDSMRVNGTIYGIPSLKDNCYIMSFIYNAEMAEALGLDMSQVKFTDWRQMEPFLTEVLEKRREVFPEYDEYPLCANVTAELPYHFQLETFLDHFYAVANIDAFPNVAGYDSDTIFNLYETDEYREYARARQRMVEKGIFAYDYTGKSEWNYTGALFGYAGWGYTYMQEHLYGDAFTTKMIVSDRIWTETKNYFSAGTAISANCAEPERAMMILNLVNTDPEFATMMRFGIEGEHYIINDEGKMQFEGSKRNGGERADYGYYYWYAAPVGNLTIVNAPESLVGPDGIMLKEMMRYNNEAVIPTHMGFVLDVTPISNEIAATTNVVMEYRDIIRNGQLESQDEVDATVDEFVAKLKANNVDKIVEEVQRQVDEWKANK